MSQTTYPIRRRLPNQMMENARPQSNRPNSSKAQPGLRLTHPHAAGIDIGSASHFIAVPPDRDDEPVREFQSFTADRVALAEWLSACGIDMVAMESTGVDWIPLYEARAEDIAKSLQGNWRAEHLFALQQALAQFDFYAGPLAACDREIEAQLQSLAAHEGSPAKGKKRSRARNTPRFDRRERLFQRCGVDLTRIDGIEVTTALGIVSVVGTDLSRFPSAKHFASGLGRCPGTTITGGNVMSGQTKRCAYRAAQALRLAAAALRTRRSAWGRTSGECAHAWTHPRPSPPLPINWLV